jgi:molybdenum cofactor cytidylyltransferase
MADQPIWPDKSNSQNLMSHKPKTAGIVLAAGMSTRYGKAKQLQKLEDKYVLEWVLDAALNSRLAKVLLVLGHEHGKILKALGDKATQPGLQIVINHGHAAGHSRSLQTGLKAAYRAFHSVMFLLGDQPRVQSITIDYLLTRFWNSEKNICVPVYRGLRGNPTLFSRAMYCRLMAISGDIGARNIISENPEQVLAVDIGDPAEFVDIDSPEDLSKLQSPL